MTTFIPTSIAPKIDLRLLRRDYFDGMSVLLQDEDGNPFNLNDVTVCASAWKATSSGTREQILTINTQKQEPLTAGRVRLWLSSAQTAQLWDTYEAFFSNTENKVFFPSTYVVPEALNSITWDMRIETENELSNLTSVASGVFITQTNHGLASSERVVFSGTAQSSINYDGTSSTIYSGLTNISYTAPYTFTVPTLTGVTDAAIGGSVYRLKQDTVVAGNVFIGNTNSNCFP